MVNVKRKFTSTKEIVPNKDIHVDSCTNDNSSVQLTRIFLSVVEIKDLLEKSKVNIH